MADFGVLYGGFSPIFVKYSKNPPFFWVKTGLMADFCCPLWGDYRGEFFVCYEDFYPPPKLMEYDNTVSSPHCNSFFF